MLLHNLLPVFSPLEHGREEEEVRKETEVRKWRKGMMRDTHCMGKQQTLPV
jgi:hypothetical protein